MTAPRPKPSVLQIAPYIAGKARAAGFASPLKLSANENPLGCSPKAREAYLAATAATQLGPLRRLYARRMAELDRFS